MDERRIEYVDVDTLMAAPRNAMAHDADGMSGSMVRFGYIDPIVLDERTGRVISGHGRWDDIAARRDAHEEPPDGIQVKGKRWLVPVVRGWSSADDADADAAALALNRIGERGGWDAGELSDLLNWIAAEPDGITGVGFTFEEVDDLLARMGDAVVLPPQATDAAHAPGAEDWADSVRNNGGGQTKAAQGLNEVVLVLQGDAFQEFQAAVAVLRRAWRTDPLPLLVLRAMREG